MVVSLSVLTFTLWDVWETEVIEGKDWVTKVANPTQPIMSPREEPQEPQPKAKYNTESENEDENDDQVADTQRMRRGRPRMMGMEGYESVRHGQQQRHRHGQRRVYQERDDEREEFGTGDDETEPQEGEDGEASEATEAPETDEENEVESNYHDSESEDETDEEANEEDEEEDL